MLKLKDHFMAGAQPFVQSFVQPFIAAAGFVTPLCVGFNMAMMGEPVLGLGVGVVGGTVTGLMGLMKIAENSSSIVTMEILGLFTGGAAAGFLVFDIATRFEPQQIVSLGEGCSVEQLPIIDGVAKAPLDCSVLVREVSP